MAGAAGAALVAMVARLTIGRKRYAEVEPQMEAVLQRAEVLRTSPDRPGPGRCRRVQPGQRRPAKLPKSSDQEQASRATAIQAAMQAASLTLLKPRRPAPKSSLSPSRSSHRATSTPGPMAASARCWPTPVCKGAALNVEVNLESIDDPHFIAMVHTATSEALAAGQSTLERIHAALAG